MIISRIIFVVNSLIEEEIRNGIPPERIVSEYKIHIS